MLQASCRYGNFGAPAGGASRGGPVELWSLGDPTAGAGMSEAVSSEEALERRARRTHCGRPCYSLVGVGCGLPGWPFDSACVQHGWSERTQAGRRLRRTGMVHVRCIPRRRLVGQSCVVVAWERGASGSRPVLEVPHPRTKLGNGATQCLGGYQMAG